MDGTVSNLFLLRNFRFRTFVLWLQKAIKLLSKEGFLLLSQQCSRYSQEDMKIHSVLDIININDMRVIIASVSLYNEVFRKFNFDFSQNNYWPHT